jgi:uncharacterized membrane protein
MTVEATITQPAKICICPACGGENGEDAVFCANPSCHKELGDFKYVAEELGAVTGWHESLAEKVTEFIGRPHFLLVHIFWFTTWVLINSGLVAAMYFHPFDHFPFGLLGIILTAEAILITGFILISQNRQNAHAEKLAEIDYEISVRTYRQVTRVAEALDAIDLRIQRLEEESGRQPRQFE